MKGMEKMKQSKKSVSVIMALVMLFALTCSVMAAQEGTIEGGSITITNAVSGQTYKAYQLLYLENYDADAGAYSYKANSSWENWLRNQTDYLSFDANGYVTWVEDADEVEFAKAVCAQLGSHSADASVTASDTTAVMDDLKLGYYIVDTSLGSLCSLTTTNPAANVQEKNSQPTVNKTVLEDSNSEWQDGNDAELGQKVSFKTVITVGKGAQGYVLHDTMSAGLSFNNDIVVKVEDVAVAVSNYTVTTSTTDGCTFEIAFTNEYISTLTEGTQIVVTYSATVNTNAVIAGDGNTNTAKLEYGDRNYTAGSVTTTHVWNMNIFKYTGEDAESGTALKGAKFIIVNADKNKVAVISNGTIQSWADISITEDTNGKVTAVSNIPEGATVISGEDGKINVNGLDSDNYYLYEVEAPAGYNKINTLIQVTIAGAETGTYDKDTANTINVQNNTGAELPSTGGVGTTMFYVIGSILVIAAVVLMVTKKRMGNKE